MLRGGGGAAPGVGAKMGVGWAAECEQRGVVSGCVCVERGRVCEHMCSCVPVWSAVCLKVEVHQWVCMWVGGGR